MVTALRLLGRPQWTRSDGSVLELAAQRRLQLLALLGCEGQWVGRDRLAALFWPGRDGPGARGNLRKLLHELRGLGVQGIEDEAPGLRWRIESDLHDFQRACGQGEWQAAARVGRGVLMQGIDDRRGGEAFRAWLSRRRQEHAADWREASLKAIATADAATALDLARALLEADPLDDAALAAAWRAATALRRFDWAQALWADYRARLAAELALEPPQALLDLVEGQASPADGVVQPLIGRQAEWQQLAALLEEGRLVTLLGPGGIGKSRLARHAAERLAPRFAQGAVWVALDDLGTPGALPVRIAAALGEGLAGVGDPAAALARALRMRSLLLVLDGFETVIDAAPLVHRLLVEAQGLRVLVTSRERLDVEGEALLPLAGLGLPPPGAEAADQRASDAVKLFATRARSVRRDFDLDHELDAVVLICRRVEGTPLALELAAAWARVMPVGDIARDLDGGLDLLAGDGLAAVFERSWQLLTAGEREAFARLAVFHGGFTREAAREVADIALPRLAALCDKSMLRSSADGRFELHATLAAFARAKLATLAAHEALAARHSRWYLARLDRQAGEQENLLRAWHHAVERGDAEIVDATLPWLHWSHLAQGRLAEAAHWFEIAAQRFGERTATGAHLRAHQAWMLLWLERYTQARQLAQAALQVLEGAQHAAGAVAALRTLGHVARRQGRLEDAAAHLREGLRRAQAAGLLNFEAALHDALAMVLNQLGRHEAARAQVYLALPLNEAQGDAGQRMYNQFNLAQSHSMAGDAVAALPWAQAALDSAQRHGFAVFLPYARTELALVLAALGRPDEADPQARQALAEAQAAGDRAAQAGAHEALGRVALLRGQPGAAREAAAQAAALCEATGQRSLAAALSRLRCDIASFETASKRPAA